MDKVHSPAKDTLIASGDPAKLAEEMRRRAMMLGAGRGEG